MARFCAIGAMLLLVALTTVTAPSEEKPPALSIALDPTFGKGGMIAEHSIPAAPKHDRFLALAIDGQGRPVAAGNSSDLRFTLARYTTDGRADVTFAAEGKASVMIEDQATLDAVGSAEVQSVFDMAIDAKGRIIVVGKAIGLESDRKSDFVVLRFDDSGRLDKSFSHVGRKKYAAHDWPNLATSVRPQPDGSILVGGYAQANSRQIDPLLIRLKDDGVVDEEFSAGANGALRWVVKDEAPAAVSGLALDKQGRCVVSLSVQRGRQSLWAVVRLKSDGDLDETFAEGGLKTAMLDEHATSEVASSVALDAAGRIVVGGYSQGNNLRRLAIARLTNDGKTDATFGSQKNGAVVLESFGINAAAIVGPRVAVAQGKIAIAGSLDAANGNSRLFGIAVLDDTGTNIAKAAPKAFPGSKGNDHPWAIAFDSQGRLVAAGGSQAPNGKWRFALARYVVSPK